LVSQVAYATLAGHLICGEERLLVAWSRRRRHPRPARRPASAARRRRVTASGAQGRAGARGGRRAWERGGALRGALGLGGRARAGTRAVPVDRGDAAALLSGAGRCHAPTCGAVHCAVRARGSVALHARGAAWRGESRTRRCFFLARGSLRVGYPPPRVRQHLLLGGLGTELLELLGRDGHGAELLARALAGLLGVLEERLAKRRVAVVPAGGSSDRLAALAERRLREDLDVRADQELVLLVVECSL